MAEESYDNLSFDSIVELCERAKFIRDMFTDNEIDALYSFMQEPEVKQEPRHRLPEKLSEKCNVLIFEFLASKYSETNSPLVEAYSIFCNKFSAENMFELYFLLKDSFLRTDDATTPILEKISAELKEDEEVFHNYLDLHGMTEGEFDNMIEELTHQKSLIAYASKFTKYWRKMINLILEYTKKKYFSHLTGSTKELIPETLYAAKRLYDTFPSICQRAESLSGSLLEIKMISCYFNQNDENKTDAVLGILFSVVLMYKLAYIDDWQHNLFEFVFDNMNEPQKLGFIHFLNLSVNEGGSPYVEEFCDAMEVYCDENEVKQPIPWNLITRRNVILARDNNNYETTQYVRVRRNKLKGSPNGEEEDRILHRNLKKLHGLLIDRGCIGEETNTELFIYRLSGLNRPDEYIMSKRILCNDIKFMAYVLRGLCSCDKEKLPASTLNKFFLSKNGKEPNFSANTNVQAEDFERKNSNPKLLEAMDILEKCGFVNCKDIHNGNR